MTHLHIGVLTTNFVSTLRVYHSFKNEIHITLQVTQIVPNHTTEHLNFKNFPWKVPPDPLQVGALWAIRGLPLASKLSPTLLQPPPQKHFEIAEIVYFRPPIETWHSCPILLSRFHRKRELSIRCRSENCISLAVSWL